MCGIFGIIRKPGHPRVRGAVPADAMERVRHRGSGLGGGFARTTARPDDHPWTVRACIDRPPRGEEVRARLERAGFAFDRLDTIEHIEGGAMPFWAGHAVAVPEDPHAVCDALNTDYLKPNCLDARVVSCSRRLDVWKDVAHPLSVATGHGLAERRGDAWIAHTREPTNSPGRYPIWSHPFTMGDVAIVHNGDISSFGANKRWLAKNGYQSFTGTDSEVIAILLHHLLEVEGRDPLDAAQMLLDPSRGVDDPMRAGAALDGPASVCATWSTAEETFLLVMVDRQKLRPMVLGEDDGAFYAASEEAQIRHVSPHATIWTPEAGAAVLFSSERGLLSAGRHGRRPIAQVVAAPPDGLVAPAEGKRFLASGFHRGQGAILAGPTGNCLAGSLDGGAVVVYGNAADDVADSMLSGRVIVHGDVRDVAGQAMQGGVVMVRGSAGNRAGLQMREYDDQDAPYHITADVQPAGLTPNRPALVIGGGADDYLGEYMAGGTAIVVNLVEGPDGLRCEGAPERPVGDRVGAGMVGGRIYIRGEVPDDAVGAHVEAADVGQYQLVAGPDAPGAERFAASKYYHRPVVRRGALTPDDLGQIGRALESFFEAFEVDATTRDAVLSSPWTIIGGQAAPDIEPEDG